jgi:hypothetical protein
MLSNGAFIVAAKDAKENISEKEAAETVTKGAV